MVEGELVSRGEIGDPAPWIRLNAAVAAFISPILWLIKESVVAREGRRPIYQGLIPWIVLAIGLTYLCYTDSFVLPARARGVAYYLYSCTTITAYTFLLLGAFRQMRKETGIRRVEMQFLVLTLSIAALLGGLLTGLGSIFRLPAVARLTIFVFLIAYSIATWAITFHRIFNVQQIFISLGQRIVVIFFLLGGIIIAGQVLEVYFSRTVSLVVSVTICCSIIFWFDRKSRIWLDLEGRRQLAEARHAVIEIARNEANPDHVISEFGSLLRERWGTQDAFLLFDRGASFRSSRLELHKERPGYVALCETSWATPESLERRRPSPSLTDLHQFISTNNLGVIVASPRGSYNPSLLIILSVKTNSWPYTYPEVERLQNIAELMDNILTRSRLTTQAALTARVEHLAMMSRGLAHDLKNLITPISSYLVHTENNFPIGSPEDEVHSAARRSVRIMTDYVREALFFSERLSPDFGAIDFAKLFDEVHATTAKRAKDRDVTVAFESSGLASLTLTGDAVLLQRLMANLVVNAIDASRAGQTVVVSAVPGRSGWVRLQVSDKGCGISSENLSRIFDPYFTTKEFGDDVRGFGLGLTICQKIAHLHGGTILVTSQPESGTIVVAELPVNPATVSPSTAAAAQMLVHPS